MSGISRFDQFEASLHIAPNMLARRLHTLVEDGLLERRLYKERPRRYEYILTPLGRDFLPVLHALAAFGNRNFAADSDGLKIVDTETGSAVDPVLVDRATGRVLSEAHLALASQGTAPDEAWKRYAPAAPMQMARAAAAVAAGKLTV